MDDQTIERLVDAAFSIMKHEADRDDNEPQDLHDAAMLRKAFVDILRKQAQP